MKRLTTLALAALLAAPAAFAAPPGSRSESRAKDRQEHRARSDRFDRLDVNRDGVITRDEMNRGHGKRETIKRSGYDRNGDNKLSRSEWPGSSSEFSRLDRNRDGLLTNGEILGRKKDKRSDRAGRFDSDRAGRFDADRDGWIERDEWRGSDRSFRRADLDRDGRISPYEWDRRAGHRNEDEEDDD
jgi:hypothetical protein